MTDPLEDLTDDQVMIVQQILYTRALTLNSMPIKEDDQPWFLAAAEDLRRVLLEWQIPVSVMDAQDAKHGDGSLL